MDGLIDSTSGHCETIMGSDVTEVGMGAHYDGETGWWVQVFGSPL